MSDAIRLIPPANPSSARRRKQYAECIDYLSQIYRYDKGCLHTGQGDDEYAIVHLNRFTVGSVHIYAWSDDAIFIASQFMLRCGHIGCFSEVAEGITHHKLWMESLSQFLSLKGLTLGEIETVIDAIRNPVSYWGNYKVPPMKPKYINRREQSHGRLS